MIELAAERLIFLVFSMFTACYIGGMRFLPSNSESDIHNILFGIGSNATGSSPRARERRIVLVILPAPLYTGWNSWWPVATETVVLSLPARIGTSIAPQADGFWLMISFCDQNES
jgi:hypothetical protein